MTLPDAAQLLEWGSATLHESVTGDSVLPSSIRPAWPGARMVGRAYPVAVAPGDNLALHWALLGAQAGDVIVADAHDADHGHWGEVMAVQAQAAGIAGLVMWGGVRDTRRQQELGFPVFSSRITPRGTVKRWAGTHGLPITIGGVVISQGDLVIADDDGVVVVPDAAVEDTLRSAAEREQKEVEIMKRLRAGADTLEIYGLQQIDAPLRGEEGAREP